MKNRKPVIIFDMDGTLYTFKGGSLKSSGLYAAVLENTVRYLAHQLKKTTIEARAALDLILQKYGTSISIGLEKEHKIDRYAYFDFAWNIEPRDYVQLHPDLQPLLLDLGKNFNLVLLSDAPKIWIYKVLDHLGIREIFKDSIFSGEGDIRKEFGNAFGSIAKTIRVEAGDCIVVGDQEETDIIPAKKIGMHTVFVGKQKSNIADYSVYDILELKEKLDDFNKFR